MPNKTEPPRLITTTADHHAGAAGVSAFARILGHDASAVPPTYAFVAAWPAIAEAVAQVSGPTIDGLLHLDHELLISAVPELPTRMATTCSVGGFEPAVGGTMVYLSARTTGEGGAVIAEQWLTILLKGPRRDGPRPGRRPGLGPRAPISDGSSSLLARIDADLPARYAVASGDTTPIHTDEAVARAVGLPGVVMHGMGTAGICLRIACEAAGATVDQVRRTAFRFAGLLIPGQDIEVKVLPGAGHLRFEATDASGQPVLTRGIAEL